AALVGLVHIVILHVGERAAEHRKDRRLGVIDVVLPQGRANSLHASAGALRKATGDLGLAHAARGEFAGVLDQLKPLLFGELAEAGATFDPFGVVADEPIDAGTEKTDPLAAVEYQSAADEAQLPPPRDGLGRNVELPGQFLDRKDLLA